MPSTWLDAGRDISHLQETLYHHKALPSLKGAASSALGFIAEIPAMGYATYFIGPALSEDPMQALPLAEAKRWSEDDAPGLDSQAAGNKRVIGNENLNLTLSAATGRLMSIKGRSATPRRFCQLSPAEQGRNNELIVYPVYCLVP